MHQLAEHWPPHAAGDAASPAPDGAAETASLRAFWRPRYWPGWILVAWLRFTAMLPWRPAIRLHKGIGSVLWLLLARRRRAIEGSIGLCFPELGQEEIRQLGRRHFQNLGACLAETAFAWFGKVDDSLTRFTIEGAEHVFAALAEGRGVILYTGHFTPVEICGPALKRLFPLVGYMFNHRRNALLEAVQQRGRCYSGHISLPNDNVRAMLQALRQQAVVWYAPDQSYSDRGSLRLPFFGHPINASTATCRLARISGAAVIPFSYRRLADDSGYALRFDPPLDEALLEDEEAGTRALVGVLEDAIAACPDQYGWMSSRLSRRLAAPADPVAEPAAPVAPHAAGGKRPRRTGSIWPTLAAIFGVALFIALADNGSFFAQVASATGAADHGLMIVVSMFLLVLTPTVLLLALSPGRGAFKLVAAVLLLTGAAAGYFMSRYGIVIDTSMIRNVAETDVREASPLMTGSALIHILLFGVLPAVVVWRLRLGRPDWKRQVGARVIAVVTSFALLVAAMYLNYGPVSFFAHENHALRLQINPVYPLYSLVRYATRADDKPRPDRQQIEAQRTLALAAAVPARPTLFVFVMGETARADRFSFNGYGRETNAFTAAQDVLNFSSVSSCGTSTADSLPCIFSHFGHDDFSHTGFAENETLYQLLGRLGVDVRWLDNSTGCKYICNPGDFTSLAGAADPDLCHDNVCVDEILLPALAEEVADDSRDHFVVLHQRGSHGPAYYTDTPDWAKVYLPECDLASLTDCDARSINNAYDNTIRYTDYLLSRVIELLQAESGRYSTAMLYVSDHGESLGEKGLYLHGLPYAIAPAEQVNVPMLFWASGDFFDRQQIDRSCLEQRAGVPATHDAIFHTLLPVFGIRTPAYDSKLDLFAACRATRNPNASGTAAKTLFPVPVRSSRRSGRDSDA